MSEEDKKFLDEEFNIKLKSLVNLCEDIYSCWKKIYLCDKTFDALCFKINKLEKTMLVIVNDLIDICELQYDECVLPGHYSDRQLRIRASQLESDILEDKIDIIKFDDTYFSNKDRVLDFITERIKIETVMKKRGFGNPQKLADLFLNISMVV